MKKKALLTICLFNLFALIACDHNYDSLKDYDEMKGFVPPHESVLEDHFYLSPNALLMNAPEKVLVASDQEYIFEVSYENNMTDLIVEGLEVIKKPEWVSMEVLDQKIIFSIKVPNDYKWLESQVPVIYIKMKLSPDSSNLALARAQYYDVEKKINITNKNSTSLGVN